MATSQYGYAPSSEPCETERYVVVYNESELSQFPYAIIDTHKWLYVDAYDTYDKALKEVKYLNR